MVLEDMRHSMNQFDDPVILGNEFKSRKVVKSCKSEGLQIFKYKIVKIFVFLFDVCESQVSNPANAFARLRATCYDAHLQSGGNGETDRNSEKMLKPDCMDMVNPNRKRMKKR